MKNGRMTIWLAVIVATVMASGGQAQNFFLSGTQEKDVTTYYENGSLFDYSLARVLQGGSVHLLTAYDNSTVDISDGSLWQLTARNNSTVNITGSEIIGLGGGSVPTMVV